MNLLGIESETILLKIGTLLLVMLLNWHIIAFKTEFKLEKYVECITNDKIRSELAALRLSALSGGVISMFRGRTGFAVSARCEW